MSNSGHSLGSQLVDYVHDYGKTLQQNNMKGKGDDSTDHTPQSHTHTHTLTVSIPDSRRIEQSNGPLAG